ncbi:MAG: hypothetical protein ACM3YO_04845 [Bacteroidota bacterium]
MRRALLLSLLASTVFAAPAWASTPLDARSLGMGSAFTAVADDANAPWWNPAGLSQVNGFFYLPTQFGIRLGNNAIGLSSMNSITETMNYWQNYQKDPLSVSANPPKLPDFLSNGNMRFFGDTAVNLLGLSFGVKTPLGKTNLGLSVQAKGSAAGSFEAADFFGSLGSAYDSMNTTDQKIATRVNNIKSMLDSNSVSISTLTDEANGIIADLDSGVGKLFSDETKQADITAKVGGYLTTMVSAAHQVGIPLPLPILNKSKVSVGANLKLFTAPLSSTGQTLPINGVNEPVGLPETIRLTARSNFGPAYQNLKNQVQTFTSTTDPSKFSEFSSAAQSLTKDIPLSGELVTTRAEASGIGCDLGAMAQVDDRLTVGATLVNPLVIWQATETTRKVKYDSSTKQFSPDGDPVSRLVNYRDTEPAALRVGASYRTLMNLRVAADLEKELTETPVALRVGGEWGLGPVALRFGTQVGGESPLVTGGLGFNLWAAKLSLGGGVNPNLQSAAAALSGLISF